MSTHDLQGKMSVHEKSKPIQSTPLTKSKYSNVAAKPDIIKHLSWGTEELKSLLTYLFTEKPARKMKARVHLTNLLENKALIHTDHISDITISHLHYYQITNAELIDFCVHEDLLAKERCFCRLSRESLAVGYGYRDGTFSFHPNCGFVSWLADTYNMKLDQDTKINISM
ncbi:unnamed protein product [Meganyctiphanes norvegica]|uniref:Uncharacterized protein n=1 Tax=Meganyctiphanes norvegica TaxID=48144 RepID=A0AAV2QI27_MEGNR